MKFNKRAGSFIILTRKNRKEVFLVKRSDFSVWECQGGGIERTETPETTAIREAYEETGFKVKILRNVAEYSDPKKNKIVSHVFEGKYISGTYIPEYKGCEGKWFDVNNLPKQMTAMRRTMIEDCLNNRKDLIIRPEIPAVSIQNINLLFLLPLQSFKYIYSLISKLFLQF
jgi:ADP-ribose pyrophosphatase YjhB (NUDIX family)